MIQKFTRGSKLKWLLSFLFFITTATGVLASHLRAGQITVVRESCSSRSVFIIITVYTKYVDPRTDVRFGEDGILSFGDGESIVVEGRDATPMPELGENVGYVRVAIPYTYSAPGSYLISYVEPNRNGGVLNMTDSFYTTFYLETRIDLAVLGCNNSPQLRIAPIDQACAGVAFFHNPGAFDDNGSNTPSDSLSYEMVIPFRDRGLPVIGYISPELMSSANELGGTPATFSIDPVNGTLKWDAPSQPGEYNVAFNVVEWRKISGVWRRIGHVRRDMQIIVNGNCKNERPLLDIPKDTCVVAGATLHEIIVGRDQSTGSGNVPDKLKIQGYSDIFQLEDNPATLDPWMTDDDDFIPTPPDLEVQFDWTTTCDHIRGQPYDVVFKITDQPETGGGPRLATFETWKITVVARAPILNTAVSQVPQRHVQLNWAPYECGSLIDLSPPLMQIWRRIDNTTFTPTNCDTGMPESLGFSLIATVPISQTAYLDTNNGQGLERGVEYCYRLVAIFPNRGAESLVSNEVCISPMQVAAPMITNVTVDKTSETDGEITVAWKAPLNPQFPIGEHEYQLQRLQGSSFMNVSPKITALTFTDGGGALNTKERQYSYRVMLYRQGETQPRDSSSVASSVWLVLSTGNRVIDLNWSADVPWSNQILRPGYEHVVYATQSLNPTTLAEFIDNPRTIEVNVSSDGFRYSDTGLDSTKTYCYAVMTRGSYGDDGQPPLENYSQINCAIPVVQEPPCSPEITAFLDSCDDYFASYACNSTVFQTLVRWSMPSDCANTINRYEVWRASTVDVDTEDYELVATVTDTFAVIGNLPSLANCFRIVAIDQSNSRSEFSNRVCQENCPNYELPNVFTPNGDKCNDFFSAFGITFNTPEVPEGDCSIPNSDEYIQRCARFVERVDFKVFNRWGKEIYDYIGQRGNENTIYINWDGRDKVGREIASGIYYYSADVTFDSTGPGGKTVKTIKGWVHLIR